MKKIFQYEVFKKLKLNEYLKPILRPNFLCSLLIWFFLFV